MTVPSASCHIHPNSCTSTIHPHAAWMCFLSVYCHWHPVSAGMEKGNCTTGGKWPCSNYTTILPPLRCHCHLARTRTSGGRWAVYSASCTQSSYIQMGWGHLRRSLAGLLLYRWRELGNWQVDAIRVESGCLESREQQWRHFDLENWVQGPFLTNFMGRVTNVKEAANR